MEPRSLPGPSSAQSPAGPSAEAEYSVSEKIRGSIAGGSSIESSKKKNANRASMDASEGELREITGEAPDHGTKDGPGRRRGNGQDIVSTSGVQGGIAGKLPDLTA